MFAAATGKKPFLGTHGANPRYQPRSRGLLRGDVKAAAQGPRLTTALAPSKQTRRQGDTRGKTTPCRSCSPCRPWRTPKHAPPQPIGLSPLLFFAALSGTGARPNGGAGSPVPRLPQPARREPREVASTGSQGLPYRSRTSGSGYPN